MRTARAAALCVALFAFDAAARPAEPVLHVPESELEPVAYDYLDGWQEDDQTAAFAAFWRSCEPILRRSRARVRVKPLERALREPCQHAYRYRKPPSRGAARAFFERHFRPIRISRLGEREGVLTGYYEPEIEGSRTPGNGFNVPIYRAPDDLAARRRNAPYYDRAAIQSGALAGRGLEICWVRDEVDAFFIQIQGSARIRLTDGTVLRVNYAGQNGHRYFAIGSELAARGIVPLNEMSMDKIRTFIAEHQEEGRELMRMNPSYVFFREVELAPDAGAVGAQGVSLTDDRSIAVDRKLHVYGMPFWIQADLPLESTKPETAFRRLTVAQDTGGAIVGPARIDIYFGTGVEAGTVAGRIHHPGTVYMLVPRSVDPGLVAGPVPAPPERPSAVSGTRVAGPVPVPPVRPRP